jgi:quinol monooxygenase YgiN
VIRLTLFIVAPAGQVKPFIATLRSVMAQALGQRGCLDCHLSADLTNPDGLHYAEQWDTDAHFREQVPSDRFKRLIDVIEAAARPPRFEIDHASHRQGLEYVEAVLRGDAK